MNAIHICHKLFFRLSYLPILYLGCMPILPGAGCILWLPLEVGLSKNFSNAWFGCGGEANSGSIPSRRSAP